MTKKRFNCKKYDIKLYYNVLLKTSKFGPFTLDGLCVHNYGELNIK